MGDRCWWEAHVKKQDAEAFCEQVLGEGLDKLRGPGDTVFPPLQTETEHYVTFWEDEANYAHWDAMEKACENGLTFYGYHGDGGEYDGTAFVSLDGVWHYLVQGKDGTPYIPWYPNAKDAFEAVVEGAKDFSQAREKVRKLLGREGEP